MPVLCPSGSVVYTTAYLYFLLTDVGVSIVDFDDLTLAPFGYDPAQLVISTAMTPRHFDARGVDAALKIYNTQGERPIISGL